MSDTAPVVTPETTPTPKDEAPEWARKEIKDANDEAARRRVENRTLSEQLTTVTGQVQTLTEQKVSAEDRANTAEANYLKLNVALSAGVPGEQAAEFASLLQGSTEQELKDHAEKIRKFGGPQQGRLPFDPSQGLGGNDNAPLTPEAEFAALLKLNGVTL